MNRDPAFPPFEQYRALIRLAVDEDLGDRGIDGDVTSRLTIPDDAVGGGTIVQKASGVACGLPAVEHVCRVFDERLRVTVKPGAEGRYSTAGSHDVKPLAHIEGPLRSVLAAERTVLNLLGRLSGIASLTRRYVEKVKGTDARVYDTRKTTPGWRHLEKYAVRRGGGENHRVGLYDMVLVKDNHLAALAAEGGANLSDAVATLVRRSRAEDAARQIEIEVDTETQFHDVLCVPGVDVILLDNMDCPTMTRCVAARDAAEHRPDLEASGGVTLESITEIARTGVDRIAVGAVTHSAPNLDIGLDFD